MNEAAANPKMADENKCPQCGTPLQAGALAGLCPACLLEQGATADTVTEGKQPSFTPPPIAELAPRFPQLEILGLIGKGGMGAVYKARQKQLDRLVALKILPPGIGEDPAFAGRFTREARALAIVPQICDALQFAHDQGIVHRDIKPENILLDRRGRVKVADFGLAKIVGQDSLTPTLSHPMGEGGATAPGEGPPHAAALTDAGKVMGTPSYMAPEQAEHPADVDHRADIYALGVVFYQMLTGELPGNPLQPPSSKVRMDVCLDEVVLRALDKDPQRRYQRVSEVKTCVETIATTPPAGSRGRESAPSESRRAPTDFRRLTSAATGEKKPWFAFCAALTYAGTFLFGGLCAAFRGGVPGGWLIGAFVLLACVTPGLAFVVKRFTPIEGQRTAFKTAAWLACITALPVIGFAAFFLFALTQERGGWNPATDEAVIVPLIWLGAVLLPVCGWRLWRAANQPLALSRPDGSRREVAHSESRSASQSTAIQDAQSLVKTPAIGLLVAGVIDLAAVFFLLVEFVALLLSHQTLSVGATTRPPSPSAAPILLPPCVALLVAGVVILFGARHMQRLKNYGWSVAASILAMITPPGLLVGLPFGIWALVVLNRREVREVFTPETMPRTALAVPEFRELPEVRRRVKWPAAGLLAVGLCGPVAAGLLIGFGYWPQDWMSLLAALLLLGLSAVIICGAWRMQRLKSYRLARLGAVVGLIVALPSTLLLVFPIWALVVLSQREVRQAFQENRMQSAQRKTALT